MINMATINSYVIYCHNVLSIGRKPLKRDLFMIELHKQLSKPQQTYRMENTPNMKRDLRNIISEVLGSGNVDQVEQTVENQKGPRKYCHMCATAKKRMTTTYCVHCNKPICGEHTVKLCPKCPT